MAPKHHSSVLMIHLHLCMNTADVKGQGHPSAQNLCRQIGCPLLDRLFLKMQQLSLTVCHLCCRIWWMLRWRLPRPRPITWFTVKDEKSGWRRGSICSCLSCCRREDIPVTQWEESLRGSQSFWSQYVRKVGDLPFRYKSWTTLYSEFRS